MQLCIDQGNSSVKWGVFEKDSLLEVFKTKDLDREVILNKKAEYAIQFCILSSVLHIDNDLLQWLKGEFEVFILLDSDTALPIRNLYRTPETLGKDRLAAAVGAYCLRPGSELLVIDAGTAITIDRVNAAGEYLGGNISPGIEMRFKAMNAFTGKLPLVELDEQAAGIFGRDTRSALQLGVLQGIVHEIRGYADDLQETYPGLSIFLTGGSLEVLQDKFKNGIFADQNLVLTGLNSILEFNV